MKRITLLLTLVLCLIACIAQAGTLVTGTFAGLAYTENAAGDGCELGKAVWLRLEDGSRVVVFWQGDVTIELVGFGPAAGYAIPMPKPSPFVLTAVDEVFATAVDTNLPLHYDAGDTFGMLSAMIDVDVVLDGVPLNRGDKLDAVLSADTYYLVDAAPIAVPDVANMPMFPWRGYTLGVALYTQDPALVESKGTNMVMVKLTGVGGNIQTADIESFIDDFRLRDSTGVETAPTVWRVRGVQFSVEKGFATAPEQESFELLFSLTNGADFTQSKLLIATPVPTERVIVSLNKVL